MENIIIRGTLCIIVSVVLLLIGWFLGARSMSQTMCQVNPELAKQMKAEMVDYLKCTFDEILEKNTTT